MMQERTEEKEETLFQKVQKMSTSEKIKLALRGDKEIRSLLTKHAGSMATSGAVSRLFQRKGQVIVDRAAASEDQLMSIALEAGAEDFRADAEGFEIITGPAEFEAVHRKVEAAGVSCASAEVTYLPTLNVPLTDPVAADAVGRLIEALEEHDDVKEVHTNAEFPAG